MSVVKPFRITCLTRINFIDILMLRTWAIEKRGRVSTYALFTVFGITWMAIVVMWALWLKTFTCEFSVF